MVGEVAVEGGAAHVERSCHRFDGLIGSQGGSGCSQLVRVELAGPAGLLALGGSDSSGMGGSFCHEGEGPFHVGEERQ